MRRAASGTAGGHRPPRLPRAARGLLAAGVALVMMAAGGCGPAGQTVEIVAGGGDSATGKPADMRVDGDLIDLAVDGAGTVRVLTEVSDGLALWSLPAGGGLGHVLVRGIDARDAFQLASGRGGEVYLAAGSSVWKLGPDGAAERVVGSGRHGEASPNGTPAGQVRAFRITGVAVAADGTLYYAEEVTEPRFLILVRAVRDGRVATVLGRVPARTDSESQVAAAVARAGDPAPGTRATDLVAGGIDARLAAAPGGKLYVNTNNINEHHVLALALDGTAAAVVAGRAPQVVRQPTTPFESIGKAVDAQPQLFLSDSRVSLSADPVSGALYLVTSSASSTTPTSGHRGRSCGAAASRRRRRTSSGSSGPAWPCGGSTARATSPPRPSARTLSPPGGTGCIWRCNWAMAACWSCAPAPPPGAEPVRARELAAHWVSL